MEKLFVVDDDADSNNRQGVGGCRELRVEPGSLIKGAGKAVKDEAAACVGLPEAVGDHLVDEVIGYEGCLDLLEVLAALPRAVPLEMLARRMSPVEIWGMP